MKTALIIVGVAMGSMILLPVAHRAVWALIPPLSPHSLAKTGHFVSVYLPHPSQGIYRPG
jgi:hypothetical protein